MNIEQKKQALIEMLAQRPEQLAKAKAMIQAQAPEAAPAATHREPVFDMTLSQAELTALVAGELDPTTLQTLRVNPDDKITYFRYVDQILAAFFHLFNQDKLDQAFDQTLLKEIYDSGQVIDRQGKATSIYPWAIPAELGRNLYQFILDHNISNTLEIGLAYGLSALFICEAHKQRGGRHTAVDPGQAEHFDNHALHNMEKAGLDGFFQHIDQPDYLALPDLLKSEQRFDMIFIDGLHLFDYVLLDFFYADLLLEPSGYIIFDDSTVPGVKRAIQFMDKNRSYNRLDSPLPRLTIFQKTAVDNRFEGDPSGFVEFAAATTHEPEFTITGSARSHDQLVADFTSGWSRMLEAGLIDIKRPWAFDLHIEGESRSSWHIELSAAGAKYDSTKSTARVIQKEAPKASPEAYQKIAVVGMSARHPKASDVNLFWEKLLGAQPLFSEVPADRWDWREFYGDHNLDPHKTTANFGGFLDNVYQFDAAFFKIPTGEAAWMDPHQRLLLEETVTCMEDAGYAPQQLAGGPVAVYMALYNDSFARAVNAADAVGAHAITGDYSFTANRISFQFNLSGPCETINTACSSANVALHRAARSLQSRDCDVALAGGAAIDFHVDSVLSLSGMGLLSKDNHCRPFNHRPSGLMPGEGVGVVMLKRLDDALAAGDVIHGVLIGSGVNHSGDASGSLTLTNAESQARLMQDVLANSNLTIEDLDYLEGHGSGGFGDEIELDALRRTFARRSRPLRVGSVKSNLGFNGAMGGITQLVKLLLMMKHNVMLPTLGFEKPPASLKLEETAVTICDQQMIWPRQTHGASAPRRAAMNAYGLGGTGAFVVVEEPPTRNPSSTGTGPHAVPFSAGRDQLHDYLKRVSQCLDNLALKDVAHTFQLGRRELPDRVVFIAGDTTQLCDQIKDFLAGDTPADCFTGTTGELAENASTLEITAHTWAGGGRGQWPNHPSAQRLSLPVCPFDGQVFPKPTADKTQDIAVDLQSIQNTIVETIGDILFLDGVTPDVETTLFDLGLDSLTSMTLVQSLAKTFALPLRETIIFDHPNISAMARHIAAQLNRDGDRHQPAASSQLKQSTSFRARLGQAKKNYPELTPLQIEGNGPILFCFHPMSGDVGLYTRLADAAQQRFRLVGIKSVGFLGGKPPLDQLETMGAYYAELITALTPNGPFHLFGSSLGGTIAYETARCLMNGGHQVEHLFMAESPIIERDEDAHLWQCDDLDNLIMSANFLMIMMLHMDPDFRERKRHNTFQWSGLEIKASELDRIPQASQTKHLTELIRTRGVTQSPDILQQRLESMAVTHQANLKALHNYRRHPLPQQLHAVLFRTQTANATDPKGYSPNYLQDIQRERGSFAWFLQGWRHAFDLETCIVDGSSHFDLLNTDASVHTIADRIADCLSPASGIVRTAQDARIAVIGMSGRFPGADSLDDFWDLLAAGETAFTTFPTDRDWAAAAKPDEAPYGGFLNDIAGFDPVFFQITPKEAELMDPAERLFLMESWRALEDAGLDPTKLAGRNWGVFCGGGGDYSLKLMTQSGLSPHVTQSSIPGRTAYQFNLNGPVVAVDGGCASSALAVAQACDQLLLDHCEAAVAGGVLAYSTPNLIQVSAQADLISSGRLGHAFGADAAGIMPAEGVGVVILKRLDAALADNDRIHGVIEAWGYNHNGRTNGMTAPGVEGEARLFNAVYDRFQVDPNTIGMVEANATGTPLGDAVEVQALTRTFQRFNTTQGTCALGSVENNVGHPFQSSGVCHLLKVLLSLRHNSIPPTPNVGRVNSSLYLEESPFYINDRPKAWPQDKRRAAVNSFGATGINVHMVVAQAPPQAAPKAEDPARAPIVLSAKTKTALTARCRDLATWLAKASNSVGLNRLAANLLRRSAHRERCALVVTDLADLESQLAAVVAGDKPQCGMIGTALDQPSPALNQVAQRAIEAVKRNHTDDLLILADLHVRGIEVDLNDLFSPNDLLPLSLPGYPFEARRCWKTTTPTAVPQASTKPSITPENTDVLELILDTAGFKAEELDRDQSFSALGFDSLMTIRLLAAINEHCNANLQLVDLLEHDTPNRLIHWFSKQRNVAPPPSPADPVELGKLGQRLVKAATQLQVATRPMPQSSTEVAVEALAAALAQTVDLGIAACRQENQIVYLAHHSQDVNQRIARLSPEAQEALAQLPAHTIAAPVSWEQERNLYHSEIMGQAAWNVQQLFRLNQTELEPELLDRALSHLAAQHDVLRTRFMTHQDTFIQVIAPRATLECKTAEVDSLADLQQFMAQRRNQLLDLSQPPLEVWVARVELTCYLGFVTHHALADAFTLPMLFNQLMDHYQTLADQKIPAPAQSIEQYWQYALGRFSPSMRQKDQPDSDGFETTRPLPFSQTPQSQGHSHPAACLITNLDADTMAEITSFCREQGTTHTRLLTAAVYAVLGVGLDNPNMPFQFVRGNRNRASLMATAGEFTDILFLRFQSTMGSLADLLSGVAQRMLDELSQPTDFGDQLSRYGFQDLAQFHNNPGGVLIDSADLDSGGESQNPYGASILMESMQQQNSDEAHHGALAALSFQILKMDGRLQIITSYRKDLFASTDIDRVVELILHVTQEITHNPSKSLQTMLDELDKRLTPLRPKSTQTNPSHAFPLSMGQQGIWAQQKTEPDTSSYHVPICFKLDHLIRADNLRQVLDLLIQSYPILSTKVTVSKGRLLQEWNPAAAIPLEEVDLSDHSPHRIDAFLKTKVAEPFDLDQGPLVRCLAAACAGDDTLVLFTVHHMVCDGRSTILFLEAFLSMYHDLLRDNSKRVVVDTAYRRYVAGEQSLMTSQEGERRLAWWRDKLAAPLPNPTVPNDHNSDKFSGETLAQTLPENWTDRLKSLAQSRGCFPANVFLGAFGLVLSAYQKQNEVIIGLPVLGRCHKSEQHALGYFIDMAPLRLHSLDALSFTDLLALVRQQTAEALDHLLPLPAVMEQIQSAGMGGELFEAVFNYQSFLPADGLSKLADRYANDFQIQYKEDLYQQGRYFEFEVMQQNSSYVLRIKYNAAVLEEAAVQAFMTAVVRTLAAVLENPRLTPTDLGKLSAPAKPEQSDTASLSYHQERLWFIDHFEAGNLYQYSPTYHNIPLLIQLHKPDLGVLRDCLNSMIRRHEILRTRVITKNAAGVPLIGADQEMSFHKASAATMADAKQSALAHAAGPFDLAKDAPVRAACFSVPDQGSLLVLTVHHMVADKSSARLLVDELGRDYSARINTGAPFSFPSQPSYSRFGSEQKLRVADHMADSRAYWLNYLSGGLKALELPESRKRPAIHTYTPAALEFTWPTEAATALAQLAKTADGDAYSVLLSTFMGLLHGYVRHDEIVVGISDPRRNDGNRRAVGPYANLLVMRADLDQNSSFDQLHKQVIADLAAARQHGDMPFDRLVSELNPAKDMSRTALFDVLFQFEANPIDMIPFGNQMARLTDPNLGYGKYDMNLALVLSNNQLNGTLIYNADIFDHNLMVAMTNHFQTLFDAITTQPKAGWSDHNLLSDPEVIQQLETWNDGAAQYPRDQTIHQLFEQQVDRTPDAVAVQCGEHHLTYRQLDDRANQLAHGLLAHGVTQDQLVVLYLGRGPAQAIAFLGVLKAGAAYLPIDPDYPVDRMRATLADAGVELVITSQALVTQLPDHVTPIVDIETPTTQDSSRPNLSISSQNLAYCIYTSGSTGRPKGALITHQNLVRLFTNDRFQFEFGNHDRWTMCHSYCFDFSVWETYGALLYGGSVTVVDKTVARDPALMLDLLIADKITVLNQTPSAFYALAREMLSRAQRPALSLRYVIFGGEALNPSLLADFHQAWPQVTLVNMYGITETTVHVTYKEIGPAEIRAGASSIGTPIPTTTLYIMDENLKLLPTEVVGELFVGGDGVCRGYLNRDDLTAQRFIQNPYKPKERLYRTGDLAKRRINGDLEYLGRLDNQIQLRGFRVELGEIENHLSRHPLIETACVVMNGEAENKRIVAWLVWKPHAANAQPALSDLEKTLTQSLPDYMIPSHFCPLSAMPLTRNGKIDRKQLAARAPVIDRTKATAKPQIRLEAQILEIWQQALELKEIGTEDGFFNVGGNSILAVTVVEEINRIVTPKINVTKMFQYPTIKALTRFILGRDDAAPPVEESLDTAPQATPPKPTELPDYYQTSQAVIGISCQLPGAADHRQFWDNLYNGVESVRFHSKDTLQAQGLPEHLINDPHFVPLNLALEDKDLFDYAFFNLSNDDAALMDPQFRHLLVHSQQACADAGYRPQAIADTAVFMSTGNSLYQAALQAQASQLEPAGDAYATWILSQGGAIPTMISYKLGLTGTSVFVHSNCSSSLTGLQLAAQTLQSGDAKCALVGGAVIFPDTRPGYLHQPGMNFSSDGRCRAFDAAADGMIGGEGVGVVLLKNAAAAVADGDFIYGILRGVAVNNDGADKVGYFAPSVQGQAKVIEKVLNKTGISPESIEYVEAHGTGTQLGDSIEFEALSETYRRFTSKTGFCGLGSVKSNVGHLDTAAGVIGCIKVLLSLSNRMVPASLNYNSPNPDMDLEHSPFFVVDRNRSLSAGRCRAALSSFGVGGANAHAVFEAYVPVATRRPESLKTRMFPLSAADSPQLQRYASVLLEFLQQHHNPPETNLLSDLAHTLQTGREALPQRALILAKTMSEVLQGLQALSHGQPLPKGVFQGRVNQPSEPMNPVTENSHDLARHWVQGGDLSWPLTPNEKPNRMSLPPLPQRPTRVTQPKPAKPQVTDSQLHPLLHANTSTMMEQRFTSHFNGNEPFLETVSPAGKPEKCLPASSQLEMVRLAAQRSLTPAPGQESVRVELSETVWGPPVVLGPEPRAVHVALLPIDNGLGFEIYSTPAIENTAYPLVHCQGVLTAAPQQNKTEAPSSPTQTNRSKPTTSSQSR